MHFGKTQIYLDMLLLISDLTGSLSEVIQDADWPSELVWWRVCVRADAQELSAVVRQRPPLPALCQHRRSTLPAVETIRWPNVVRVHLIHVASILYYTAYYFHSSKHVLFASGCPLTSVWWSTLKGRVQTQAGTSCGRSTSDPSRHRRSGWLKPPSRTVR